MKKISLFIASLVFAIAFAGSALAQTPAPVRIGIINTFEFGGDDKGGGITRYINAVKSVNAEFAPAQLELDNLNKRFTALAKEIQVLREQATKVPIDEKAANAKVEEAERLQRDIKFRQEDAKARYERRQQAVIAPVMQDIGNAVNEYARQKGYTLIFDVAKDEAGLLLAIGDEKINVTKDFITFYNARPASTATAAPKTAVAPK